MLRLGTEDLCDDPLTAHSSWPPCGWLVGWLVRVSEWHVWEGTRLSVMLETKRVIGPALVC